jgi:hypothetical protein
LPACQARFDFNSQHEAKHNPFKSGEMSVENPHSKTTELKRRIYMNEVSISGVVEAKAAADSKKMIWAGRIISGIMVLFMLMDGVMKLIKPEAVVKGTMELGFPENTIVGIGIVLLISTVLYLIPRTAVLGAILLTGYLGGAIASQVRVSAVLFNLIFPFLFGVLIWLGLFLRDSRVRELIPLRS